MPRWVIIFAILVLLYLLYRNRVGSRFGPIKVTYDKIGQALDRAGVPFNSYGVNPSR